MNQEVVTTIDRQPQTAEEIKTQIKRIQEIHRSVMLKDVHYGTIPGTGKPTLYKAGSELLLTTFRIAVDPDIEDLSGPDEIRYRVTLRGIASAEMRMDTISGILVGAGVGECSTNEEKYKWRAAMPKEWAATDEDRRRIKYGWKWAQARGEKIEIETPQVRTNPADLANTVLKMAKKRAQVDLCLTALAASDVFDQDLEDSPRAGDQPDAHPKSQTTAPKALYPDDDDGPAWPESEDPGVGMGEEPETPAHRSRQPNGGAVASSKQISMLKAKLYTAKLGETDFCRQFDLDVIDRLPRTRVDEALTWIGRA